MLSDVGGVWGVSKCFELQLLIFLLKKIGFAQWTDTMLSPNAGVTLANLLRIFFDSYSAQNISVTTLKINVII